VESASCALPLGELDNHGSRYAITYSIEKRISFKKSLYMYCTSYLNVLSQNKVYSIIECLLASWEQTPPPGRNEASLESWTECGQGGEKRKGKERKKPPQNTRTSRRL